MHRSSSTNRFSEEFRPSSTETTSLESDKLPTYNPDSHVAKKERSRLRSAENAVHLIPLVLVVCAIILWFFSNPVDIVNKGDSNVDRIKGLTISSNMDGDGTQSSLLPNLELEDVKQEKQTVHHNPTRLLENKST